MQIPNSSQCDICADRGPCFYCGRSDRYAEINILNRIDQYEKEKEGTKDKADTQSKDAFSSGKDAARVDTQ